MRLKSGRSVASDPAMIPVPSSMVDQIEMFAAFQKKSGEMPRPLMYLKRTIEQRDPKAPRLNRNTQTDFVRRSILACHRMVTGRAAKIQSVEVVTTPCSYATPRITLLETHFPSIASIRKFPGWPHMNVMKRIW